MRTGKNQKLILQKLENGSRTVKQLVDELNLKYWAVGYQAVKSLQKRGSVTYNDGVVSLSNVTQPQTE